MKTPLVLLILLLSFNSLNANEGDPEAFEATISQTEPGSRVLEIQFSNRTEHEVSIIRPLDGSLWKWHFPYYDFTVLDSDGKELKLMSRCGVSGLWADTEWPKDYLIPIKPETTKTVKVLLPHDIPKDGDYVVTFKYEWSAKVDRSDLPKSIFVGVIESKPIRIRINKRL